MDQTTPQAKKMGRPRRDATQPARLPAHTLQLLDSICTSLNHQVCHGIPNDKPLKNGDIVEVVMAPVSTPNPAWLGFVRTGRARSKIRHHLKTLAHAESQDLGLKLLTQASRSRSALQSRSG